MPLLDAIDPLASAVASCLGRNVPRFNTDVTGKRTSCSAPGVPFRRVPVPEHAQLLPLALAALGELGVTMTTVAARTFSAVPALLRSLTPSA